MKILQATIITIAIVLMIIVSPMTHSTLSFAVRTNSTAGTGTQHNNNNNNGTASSSSSSKIASISPPKITATNPVGHNATTLMGGGPDPCSNTKTVDFLWDHVYGASGNGKEPWNQPGPNHSGPSRLTVNNPSCITVTGTVYSAYPGGTQDDPDGDGDLHFTLTLDSQYAKFSQNDPQCKSSHGLPNPCYNIIVEVICHTEPAQKYKTTWGNYCSGVNPVYYMKNHFPTIGDRLSVSGKFVFDTGREQWNEIHPATSIHSTK
jgi:hypothetical protein